MKSHSNTRISMLVGALLMVLVITPALGQSYTITDLGTIAGGSTFAYAINNHGHVVGSSSIGNLGVAFHWTPGGGMESLGVIPGFESGGAIQINDSDIVTGYYWGPNNSTRAFIWSQTTGLVDPGAPPGYRDTASAVVNNNGDIVVNAINGAVPDGFLRAHAFSLINGVLTDLNIPGATNVNDLNDVGQVLCFGTISGAYRAFIWSNNNQTALASLPGWSNTYGTAINNSGQAVGVSNSNIGNLGISRATLWNAGVPVNLGTLGGSHSFASGLNDLGHAVGGAQRSDGSWRAFCWRNGQMEDLTAALPAGSGWSSLEWAYGINNVGQIVGYGTYLGQVRGFLLTPVLPDTTPPVITITSPTANTYGLNQQVAANYSASDADSGVASVTGTVANGAFIDTSSVGTKTFTVTAIDNAGNTATQTVTYTVGYAIKALYDQTRAHKSGSTVPIKLQLCDANGANVSSPDIVLQATGVIPVSTSAPGALEDSGNANPDNNFRYDAELAGYIFNLKTTGYATGTYRLHFTAGADPTSHSVEFQIR